MNEHLSLVYTTLPDYEAACKVCSSLLEAKLIACANIFRNVTSMYYWGGEPQQNEECVVIMKTLVNLSSSVIMKIQEVHPYDTPALLAVDANCSSEFLMWVLSQVGSPT